MIEIEAITQLNGLLGLKDEWNNLYIESNIDHPFLTFEWISCFWQSYSKNNELFVLILRDKAKILGIIPLMKTTLNHRGLRLKAATSIADYYHTSRAGFILTGNRKEALVALTEYLHNTNTFADVYLLPYIVKGSENEMLLSDVMHCETKLNYIKIPCLQSPYIKIDQSWDSYFKTRSKKFRDHFTNLNNRYKRAGYYEIIKYTNEGIEKGIEELLSISVHTWQHDYGSAIASSKSNISFYTSFIKAAAARGWLNLFILRKNSKPIAFVYDLVYKGIEYGIKIGYDKEYSKESPGEYLIGNVIKNSFAGGMTEFELMGGPNSYKMRWTSLCKEHVKYMIFGRTFCGKILRFLELSIIPWIKKIRDNINSLKLSPKYNGYREIQQSPEK